MTTYGEFGGKVTPPVPTTDGPDSDYRREKVITTVVGGQRVTLIIRDTIVPEDPYLNMVRAAAFVYMSSAGPAKRFPVPPVGRLLKDALIKTDIVI